jgi:uncharacterized RmlC-like cupin family protein
MQLLTIPPGGRAFVHKHETHETAIYALSGVSHVWHGERLEHHSIVKPGDFFYIPAVFRTCRTALARLNLSP